ncbi:hypothetical protein OQX63_21005 [Pedobacter sp. PF22-3]|uniref:hypothetical protein n=1 Tax=Pedobacter sp. PF22-3 TaxID=2994467 RepID=UPI00224850F4|nr:hypothetical protein [Pedobacter sp. PF22-3]MCX2495988.1 hypothetical protein [Pedobacter sp. PF22-3]
MENYLYQYWFRGKRKLHTEESTLFYYSKNMHLPTERAEDAKAAKKFLKTCASAEEWARYAYTNDLPFSVCKLEEGKVVVGLEEDVTKDLTVFFLDEYYRLFMYYVFRKQPNDNYFCIGIMFWEFEEGKSGDDDDKTAWTYIFETNGNVEVIEQEKSSAEECVWKSKRPLNVESNWEPAPEFGDWEGLMKMERWKQGELDELFKRKESENNNPPKKPFSPWLPPDWEKNGFLGF